MYLSPAMKRLLFFFICLWLLSVPCAHAQGGFSLIEERRETEIPFEYVNNFIIVTLNFNGSLPLRFIFDTGAEYTILTKREFAEVTRVQYEREFRILGSDLKTVLVAYLARRVRFELPGKIVAPREDILVLQDDYFRFEEYAGVNVQGILSGNVFSHFIIKINYQRKVITLYDRDKFKQPGDDFVALPIEMIRNKPYLHTQVAVGRDTTIPVKLLLDTGAGLPLMLFTNTHPLLRPPATALAGNIGMGLGGFLDGFIGRIHRLEMGPFEQVGIITHFQQADSMATTDALNKRNGLIGNIVLSRFVVIFDYQAEKIWLKPTKYLQRAFEYDRSGLSVIASGRTLGQFDVQYVIPGSPADEAGILKGDRIKRIGFWSSPVLTFSYILQKLKGKPGKKVKIVVKRNGKRLKKTLLLRDLL